jgi:hypothetical protein
MIAPLPLLLACADTPVDGWFVVVEGRVVAADGAPLDAAEVALFAPDGAAVAVTTTGPDGAWTLPILGEALAGNQLVAFARADGYTEGRATFDLNLAAPRVTSLSAGPGQTWDTTARRLSAIQLAPAASTDSPERPSLYSCPLTRSRKRASAAGSLLTLRTRR